MPEPGTTVKHPTQYVLGVPISLLDMKESISLIEQFVKSGECHMVVTADASGFVIANSDPVLSKIYNSADLLTPDSQGVVWALRRQGIQGISRVSGVDLVNELCALSSQRGYSIVLLGAAPGVADMAAEKLRLKHPGCNIIGTRHGYFPAEDDEIVANEIAHLSPDFLFVALGIPRQEKFIAKTKSIIRSRVAIGVGGSFDVFSGRTKRAPLLIQKLKMEWLWRLMLNPSKFSKVKMLPQFINMVRKDQR